MDLDLEDPRPSLISEVGIEIEILNFGILNCMNWTKGGFSVGYTAYKLRPLNKLNKKV